MLMKSAFQKVCKSHKMEMNKDVKLHAPDNDGSKKEDHFTALQSQQQSSLVTKSGSLKLSRHRCICYDGF